LAQTLNEIQAVSDKFIVDRGKAADIYAVDFAGLWFMFGYGQWQEGICKPRDMAPGGEYMHGIVEYARANSGAYGEDRGINIARKRIFDAYRYDWGGISASHMIGLKDQTQNFADQKFVDMVQGKVSSIQKTACLQLAIHCYDGTGTNDQIDGLGLLFDTAAAGTSTKYGNIAEADVSKWAAKFNEGGASSTMSYEFLQLLVRDAAVGSSVKDRPTVILTCTALKDAFDLSEHTRVRHKSQKLLDVGFDHILFNGIPIVVDRVMEFDANSGSGYTDRVYALNTRYLTIMTHPKFAFTKPEWRMHDSQYPDAFVGDSRWQGNIVCKHRAAHSLYNGVSA
jgi:hypothetical protein